MNPDGTHPLHATYTFWYQRRDSKESWIDSVKKLASFDTVERFWDIYSHLIRPQEVHGSLEYYVFRDGIKPLWEDPVNAKGGKWTIKLKKGLATHCWELLLLALVGGEFEMTSELCGVALSVRHHEDHLSLWHRTADNRAAADHMHAVLSRVISIPGHAFEYKRHDSKVYKGHSKKDKDDAGDDSPVVTQEPEGHREAYHKEKRVSRPHWSVDDTPRPHWSVDDGKTGHSRPYKPYGHHTGGGSKPWHKHHHNTGGGTSPTPPDNE